jgi:hypothetical protein
MEQRYSQRVPLDNPIRVSLQRIGQKEGEKTMLGDLSLDGSFFLVDHDWDIGTELDVEIEVPVGKKGPTEKLHMRGTVARSEKVGQKTGIGVNFRVRSSDSQ